MASSPSRDELIARGRERLRAFRQEQQSTMLPAQAASAINAAPGVDNDGGASATAFVAEADATSSAIIASRDATIAGLTADVDRMTADADRQRARMEEMQREREGVAALANTVQRLGDEAESVRQQLERSESVKATLREQIVEQSRSLTDLSEDNAALTAAAETDARARAALSREADKLRAKVETLQKTSKSSSPSLPSSQPPSSSSSSSTTSPSPPPVPVITLADARAVCGHGAIFGDIVIAGTRAGKQLVSIESALVSLETAAALVKRANGDDGVDGGDKSDGDNGAGKDVAAYVGRARVALAAARKDVSRMTESANPLSQVFSGAGNGGGGGGLQLSAPTVSLFGGAAASPAKSKSKLSSSTTPLTPQQSPTPRAPSSSPFASPPPPTPGSTHAALRTALEEQRALTASLRVQVGFNHARFCQL
jgi:hypothetical protein